MRGELPRHAGTIRNGCATTIRQPSLAARKSFSVLRFHAMGGRCDVQAEAASRSVPAVSFVSGAALFVAPLERPCIETIARTRARLVFAGV
jgi:hypothetical protein